MRKFFITFLKYVLFILPFILVFKALYTCWLNGVWDFQFVSQQLISNLPFVGKTFFNIIWKEESLLYTDIIRNNQFIMELTFVGGLGGSLGRAIVETYFSNFTKVPIEGDTFMSSSNVHTMNSDSATNPGSSTSSTLPSEAAVDWLMKDVRSFTGVYIDSNKNLVDWLSRMNEQSRLFNMDKPECISPFWKLIHSHSDIVVLHFDQRIYWVNEMSKYLDQGGIDEVQIKIARKDILLKRYLDNVEKLGDKEGDIKGKFTQFYNLTNAYRNACNKEVNSMESLINENIRGSALFRNRDLKQSVNVDYAKAKKAFSDQDQILRKRWSEILNAPKK